MSLSRHLSCHECQERVVSVEKKAKINIAVNGINVMSVENGYLQREGGLILIMSWVLKDTFCLRFIMHILIKSLWITPNFDLTVWITIFFELNLWITTYFKLKLQIRNTSNFYYEQMAFISRNFKLTMFNERNHKFAMMVPLYLSSWVGPIAIALIFPQLTLEGLVYPVS